MKPSRWVLVGIGLTLLWVVVAGLYTRTEDVAQAENFANFAYKVCTDSKMISHDADLSSCETEKLKNLAIWMKGSNGNVAVAALAPIPFGWLAGLILIYVQRILVAGFRATVPWIQMSWPKKSFAIFCMLFLCGALLVGSTAVMNLYVDTKVPVTLSPFIDVSKIGDDAVHVAGTWTRRGRTEKSALGYPLQTSTIDCNRVKQTCIEARSYVAGNVLSSELVSYDVQRWSKDAVVMRNEGMCTEEVFTIDLNTKAVSGAGRRVNVDTAFCKLSPSDETEWSYRMESGFAVYWDQRKKARPAFLRIIQSFFGN